MKLSDIIKKYGDIEIDEVKARTRLGIKTRELWQPTINEVYFYIDSYCDVRQAKFEETYEDERCVENLNCFKTYNEALFESKKRKVTNQLKKFALEYNDCEITGDSYQEKYYIYYNYDKKWIAIEPERDNVNWNNIYFTDEEMALEAIEIIGEERLKTYYFGVKE